MKYIPSFLVLFLLFSFQQVNGIYDIALKTIDGNATVLSQYKGKKLLFLVLPPPSLDPRVSVQEIAQLQAKYQSSLLIIGIPAYEEGYKKQDVDNLIKTYRADSANIILTEGMNVKKGTGQSPLFQWLTNKDMNRHFDREVQGGGSKFFVDEGGNLYAVMGPELKLTSPLIDRILSKSPIKK